ncbi:MAG: 30S ribosomal protein S4, partial [Oscillospiraceae bacterium]
LMAEKQKGIAGENLLRICESRLDNVVYLLGWASSRAEARQLTVHGHYLVNGKKVDVPSYLLKVGDTISIKDKSREGEKIKAVLEANASRPVPQWLDKNAETISAKVINLPEREQIEAPVEEHLIVEFYSK